MAVFNGAFLLICEFSRLQGEMWHGDLDAEGRVFIDKDATTFDFVVCVLCTCVCPADSCS